MNTQEVKTLYKQICGALEHDTRINLHTSQLLPTIRDGRIILEGTVDDIASKRIAINLVQEIAGDQFNIEDQLRVHSSGVGDGALRDKILNAMLSEPVFRNCGIVLHNGDRHDQLRDNVDPEQGSIEIFLEDGIVTLSGYLISLTHRRLAEVILWWIDGVRHVNNQIQIVPQEDDSDDELTDAVRMALEKDPFVDAGQIQVDIKAGIVELNGWLTNETQRVHAERDVWSVPGVRDIHSHIDIATRTA